MIFKEYLSKYIISFESISGGVSVKVSNLGGTESYKATAQSYSDDDILETLSRLDAIMMRNNFTLFKGDIPGKYDITEDRVEYIIGKYRLNHELKVMDEGNCILGFFFKPKEFELALREEQPNG